MASADCPAKRPLSRRICTVPDGCWMDHRDCGIQTASRNADNPAPNEKAR
jgi:hypothetical protein